jgi:phospholipid transport system substrate-binding protein
MQRVVLILLVFITFLAQALAVTTMQPEEIVKTTLERFFKAISKEGERLKRNPQNMQRLVDENLLPVIDFDAFSKLTLGHNWRKATPDQRRRFTQAFKGMLIRTYTKYLLDYSDAQVTVLPNKEVQRNPKRQMVLTELSQPGKPPLAVNYSFWLNEGAWRVYNVSVDGLSLVHLFRTEFDREINQTSMDALIERLAKTNIESTENAAGEQERTP